MADVDIDPFGEHESRPEESTDEHIPLDPVTPGRLTWYPRGSLVLQTHGKQLTNIKHHSEESLKELNS